MSARYVLRILHVVFIALMTVSSAVRAQAPACLVGTNFTVAVGSTSLASYNPFAATAVIKTVPVIVTNNSASQCDLALAVKSLNASTATLSNGTSNLNFVVENQANTKSIFYTGISPPAADRVNINNLNSGSSRTINIDVYVQPNQLAPAGALYSAQAPVSLDLFNRPTGNTTSFLKSTSFPVSVNVQSICQLGAPSATTLSFASGDIPNGLPNEGVVRSSTMTASCTAPTRVRLVGKALTSALVPTAPANFDNFINYRAVGIFGAATATLHTTTVAANADSPTYNGVSNSTVTGTVSVNVNLKKSNNPIVAGTYTGTLTVTLDPNL